AIPAARGASGGPDPYGYTWTDSKPVPGVTYSWIDGVTGGTDLLVDTFGCTFNRISFQFAFKFYNTTYNDATVCANGFLAFNTPATYPWDTDGFASAFGYDLDPSFLGSGHVFAKADLASSPRRFIVTWNGVFTLGTTDRQKFEIVLIEGLTGLDGQILFQYASLTNPPPNPLVGIDNLGSTSNLYYAPALENSLAVKFLPPGTPPPGDTLTVRGASLAPLTVEPGQKDIPILRLNVSTVTNSVNLRRVRVDVTGIVSLPGDVSSVSLWRDADGDGQLDKTRDSRLTSGAPGGSPESAILTLPTPLTVPAGPGRNLLVSYDVALSAVPGDWIGAGVLGAGYVTVDPPDNVSSANFPLDTYLPGVRTHIVEGVDSLRATSWSAVNPRNVTQWQTDDPMLAATFDVDKGAVTVTRIGIYFPGTRPADVYLAKLFEDVNRDHVLQPRTDRLLSRAVFNGSGNLGFAVNLQFVAGSPRILLLSFDIAPDATPGDLVGARIAGPASFSVQGTKDRVDPSNFPIETAPLSTVQVGSPPEITSRWAVTPPNPDGQVATGEYILSSENSKDLSVLGGNSVAALITVENDLTYAYVAYDATGDASPGMNDSASMAFLTNRTAFPFAPPDDEFGAGGPMGPFHAVWNETTASWRIEDACSPALDANHTGLACSIGFDRSPLSSVPHRIYEFRIPLRLLEVPASIPAGYSIGFAAASNWSRGIENREFLRNSSWPLVDPAKPPRWYGVLRLANAPPINTPPNLNWTGEPGFVGDGVSPDNGTTLTSYDFRIKYTNLGGNPPALGDPSLHVLEGASEIAGSPVSMTETDLTDRDVTDGKVYGTVLTFDVCPRTFSYFFSSWDDTGANATPTSPLAGPQVQCPPSAPGLTNGSVSPLQGSANLSNFTWSVEYRDADRNPPARIETAIYKGGSPLLILPMARLAWLGSPNNYSEGARFGATRNLTAPGADYSFSFLANDSLLETTTPPIDGPSVISEPSDLLLVTFTDEAPVIADAGQRNVKMLSAILQASANSVSVRGLRIDGVGGAIDTDVAEGRLYVDVDGNGVPDVLLGRGPFTGGRIVFSGFRVDVTAGSPVQLIVLVDVAPNAASDDRVGLRVLGASYIQVAPPDVVAPFALPYASFLVNRAPAATGLSAEGATSGTPAVLHITNPQPRLAWTYSDPNANDFVQAAFNVSLTALPGGLVWWVNGTGATSSVAYNGTTALADGARYRIDVRVFDRRLWGTPATLEIRMNTPPPAPILSGPPDNAVNQGPDSVDLQWNAVADAEGDSASYRWTLATRADFVGAVTGTTPAGATSAVVATAGATKYYWKVEAFDLYEWSPTSTTWSFTTHAASGRVFGRVVHAGSGLIAVVQLYNGAGNLAGRTTTNASGDGSFAISDIPFGTYEVRVTSQGYQPKTLGVTLTPSTPTVDLGGIDMTPNALGGIEWTTIILFGLLIAAIAAVIAVVAIAVGRRRRAAVREAAPRPGPTGPSAAPTAEGVAAEELAFECPECGTGVTADATSCPGCGALFE
ncbi:MAG: hypothetical protein E6K16_02520, partial [Methanobacteriota archaeon]